MTQTTPKQPVTGAPLPSSPLLAILPALVLAGSPALASQDEGAVLEPTAPAEPADPALEELAEEVAGGPAPELTGMAWLRSRFRWNRDEQDQDLFGNLVLDYGQLDRDGWSAHLSAALFADLDGEEDGEFTFVGLHDTYDDAVRGRLDLGYVDTDLGGELELLRVGRQQLYQAPQFAWFDGVRLEGGPANGDLLLGAWGGVAVRPWQGEDLDDLLGGAYLVAHPWWRGRLRMDYMRFEDDSLVGEGSNDLVSFALRQGLREGLDLETEYSTLDGERRDLELALSGYGLTEDLTFRLVHYELLEPQDQLANELDPFTSTTLTLLPYTRQSALVSKGFGETLIAEAGLDLRRLSDEDDLGEYNRDFERYFVRCLLPDVGDSGFDLTLTGEAWRSDDNDLETWGVDVRRELSRQLELGLGSYYSLYKYDLYLNAERDDVRTWQLDLEYDLREDLRLDLDYVFEDDDFGNQNTMRLGLRWSI